MQTQPKITTKLTAQTTHNENDLHFKVKYNKHMKYVNLLKYKKEHQTTTARRVIAVHTCHSATGSGGMASGCCMEYGSWASSHSSLSQVPHGSKSRCQGLCWVAVGYRNLNDKNGAHTKIQSLLTSVLTCMDQSTLVPFSHPSESHCEGFCWEPPSLQRCWRSSLLSPFCSCTQPSAFLGLLQLSVPAAQ